MIRKSDMLKVNTIKYYKYEQDLVFNVLYDHYLNKAIIPLKYFYRELYGDNRLNNMKYEAKFFV